MIKLTEEEEELFKKAFNGLEITLYSKKENSHCHNETLDKNIVLSINGMHYREIIVYHNDNFGNPLIGTIGFANSVITVLENLKSCFGHVTNKEIYKIAGIILINKIRNFGKKCDEKPYLFLDVQQNLYVKAKKWFNIINYMNYESTNGSYMCLITIDVSKDYEF